MPGILPMKVIRVGTNAQSRIAQACDRCRSKKIRCDGATPYCTQCANVGFDCKTSDKLSRRAFPRGYTESLEERVRSLETEVKELKGLLDEKDEKIDLLSNVHSNSFRSHPHSTNSPSRPNSSDVKASEIPSSTGGDTFTVSQSTSFVGGDGSGSLFVGASSGRSFVDEIRSKIEKSNELCGEFSTNTFFEPKKTQSLPAKRQTASSVPQLPSRMVADHLINIYFQEWAPLLPVLHRPTTLKMYTNYMGRFENSERKHEVAIMNLIFGIAAMSAEGNAQSLNLFEAQWIRAIDLILEENTLSTLQCLILAQMYYIAQADYSKLLHYKSLAISLSQRLGLHIHQKDFSLGVLERETRKKAFWTLYTLDCYSAALLGLPKLMNDFNIYVEYPVDINDENISEEGYQSALPGDSTRVFSALALFRLSRILSRVLDEIYPAAPHNDLSVQKISALNTDLDEWLEALPADLRLHFVQDKPSTDVTGSRSPFLSLGYHYVRSLIHRPAVCSKLGDKVSSSVIALAQSSKHLVQIIQLLEERKMSFSFCLNKNEILLLAGFGLVFQCLIFNSKCKIVKDSQKMLYSVIELLERNFAPGAAEFKEVVCANIDIDESILKAQQAENITARRKSEGYMPAPNAAIKSVRKLQAFASRFSSTASEVKKEYSTSHATMARTLSVDNIAYDVSRNSWSTSSSIVSEPMLLHPRSDYTSMPDSPQQVPHLRTPNLDYLSFSGKRTPQKDIVTDSLEPYNASIHAPPSIENGFLSTEFLNSYQSGPSDVSTDWALEAWNVHVNPGTQQTTSSFSEKNSTAGEEFSKCEAPQNLNNVSVPSLDGFVGFENLDQGFGSTSV